MLVRTVELYATAFLSFWKYWSDDGLFGPKLVANNRKNKLKDSCVRRSKYFNILLRYLINFITLIFK